MHRDRNSIKFASKSIRNKRFCQDNNVQHAYFEETTISTLLKQ